MLRRHQLLVKFEGIALTHQTLALIRDELLCVASVAVGPVEILKLVLESPRRGHWTETGQDLAQTPLRLVLNVFGDQKLKLVRIEGNYLRLPNFYNFFLARGVRKTTLVAS